ncbi:urease accessory protein UreD [Paenibacillus daejeonensis]|uniref:urease accessory protein UreD n=1 Tax=Paenibacillus daejeonensis TaxID=135193 RepID=UPI0012FAE442|nr:urease accessory protein UreD [Paenibacillus daejeonensis]
MKWRMPVVRSIPILTVDAHPLRRAELRASFAHRNGRTVLAEKYHTAPIKIAKTFQLEEQLGAIVLDVSPGLLKGDHYELSWEAGPGTHLYLTNQSYTKVHPCDVGGCASMKQQFTLASDAIVESMMEPVMLYKDAAFRNETKVEMGRGSVWMQAEVLCPGRTLRGETFDYQWLDNRLQVSYEGELIFGQRQRIDPALHQLQSAGAWEDLTHTGTFYVFSERIGVQHVEAVRAALDRLPVRDDRLTCGVSLTHRYGLAVLAAGRAAWHLQEVLEAAWTVIRKELLDAAPLQFRK